jgi:uncharacterized protein YcbK (DUF882 family)
MPERRPTPGTLPVATLAAPSTPDLTRRRLVAGCAYAAGSLLLGTPALVLARPGRERTLDLLQLHTDEHLRVTYWAGGTFDDDALARINHLLRDHRTDEQHPIDTGLLDLLHRLQARLGRTREIHVVSGYRSPRTNAMLRQVGGGVAKRSLHMLGQAIDVRIPGVATETVAAAARELRGGGVGLYRESRFVHLDTGRVRTW